MTRLSLNLGAVLIAALVADSGFGHGSYPPPPSRGHGPAAPPYTGPGDITMPGGPNGPTTPGSSGPITPGGAGGPRTPSGPPTTPGGARGPISAGPGFKKNRGTSLDTWETWWRYNREPYIHLRARMARGDTNSGGLGFLSGAGHTSAAAGWQRPTREEIERRVTPVLLRALDEDSPEILDSALIALGRSTHPDDAAPVLGEITSRLESAYPSVQQSALLALGMIGDRSAAPMLWSVMNDATSGRDLLSRSSAVPTIERSLAALALGFASGPEMVPQLIRLFDRASADEVDVLACAVLSLGLIDGASNAVVPFLSKQLADGKLDRRVRAQVPITLGRLAEDSTMMVGELLKVAVSRSQDDAVQQSAIIGLGEIASAVDDEVILELRKLLRSSGDATARHFAYIALGRIGARSLAGRSSDMGALNSIKNDLLAELADPSHGVDVPWCALAVGVLGHEMPRGTKEHGELAGELRDALTRTKNPSEEAALATALGMVGDLEAGPLLRQRFLERSDPAMRAHLAVALGMTECVEAADDLRASLFDQHDPDLRVAAATALGWLGDHSAAAELVNQLRDAPTLYSVSSIARALGRIGGRQHIQALIEVIENDSLPDAVRGFACVALGSIAERGDLPWNTPLSIHSNYLLSVRAQAEVLDIL